MSYSLLRQPSTVATSCKSHNRFANCFAAWVGKAINVIRPPVDDILFTLKAAAGTPGLMARGIFADLDQDTIDALLREAGKFAAGVLAPLNHIGDLNPARQEAGRVETTPGWRDAYRAFAEAGWTGLSAPADYGGQELPQTISLAVSELWNAANLSFALCPMLTQAAIDAIDASGSQELKARFLPPMISGEWTGTMNLTEPQAGSDLSSLSTVAARQEDGTYRIKGTKVFITYGDHDLSENIIHLVLARLSGAPPGVKGISLFLVPKRLVGADGSLGAGNDVLCVGLERKLGIHASPTAVMKYGEQNGALGYLVGEENRGLEAMFVMMNAARLSVGMQGVAVAERATQHAIAYAQDRRQGHAPRSKGDGMAHIVEHPDVRRSLLTMRAMTYAARCICYATARELDLAKRATEPLDRESAATRAALLTPVAKAFATDAACEVASLGVQVHGGFGFIEESGAAQFYRDARILPIYEGTNGIQAVDLVTRKLPLDDGNAVRGLIFEMEAVARALRTVERKEVGRMGQRLLTTVLALDEATEWMLEARRATPSLALAGATPYLRLMGLALAGHHMARGARIALKSGGPVAMRHLKLARFFAENISVAGPGLATAIVSGGGAVVSNVRELELA